MANALFEVIFGYICFFISGLGTAIVILCKLPGVLTENRSLSVFDIVFYDNQRASNVVFMLTILVLTGWASVSVYAIIKGHIFIGKNG